MAELVALLWLFMWALGWTPDITAAVVQGHEAWSPADWISPPPGGR